MGIGQGAPENLEVHDLLEREDRDGLERASCDGLGGGKAVIDQDDFTVAIIGLGEIGAGKSLGEGATCAGGFEAEDCRLGRGVGSDPATSTRKSGIRVRKRIGMVKRLLVTGCW